MKISREILEYYKNEVFQDRITLPQLISEWQEKGYSEEEIKEGMQELRFLINQQIAINKNKAENDAGKSYGAFILSFIICTLSGMMEVSSFFWIAIFTVLQALIGFYCFPLNRWAGAIASVITYLLCLYAYPTYFEGRSSYLRIEILIPFLISAIPGYIILKLVGESHEN